MSPLQQEIDRLQKMAEQWLPENIRNDYDSIEMALVNDELHDFAHFAGQVVLWTCDMFQHIDEDFEYYDGDSQ